MIIILPYWLYALLLSACFKQDNQHYRVVTWKEYSPPKIFWCTDIFVHHHFWSFWSSKPHQHRNTTTQVTSSCLLLHQKLLFIGIFFLFVESFFFLQYKKWYSKYLTVANTTEHAFQIWHPNLFYFLSVYIIYKKKKEKHLEILHIAFLRVFISRILSKSFI